MNWQSVREQWNHRLNIRRRTDIEKPADLMRQDKQHGCQRCH
ncbi:hypothetical protein [Pseudomonas sp. EggHat1]|nr:hypothetical protein [Pseudomonas sp. EggHat1]